MAFVLQHDVALHGQDIRELSSREGVRRFFARLGYNTEANVEQTVEHMGFTTDELRHAVKHIQLIADEEDGALQVYLVELRSVTVSNTQAIARALRNRGSNFLFVLTSDYERLDFVLFELTLPTTPARTSIGFKGAYLRPRMLTVARVNPTEINLRVLRRFSNTEADAYYQFRKLQSAYSIAEWTEQYFNNRALFSDYYLKHRFTDCKDNPAWCEDPRLTLKSFQEMFAGVRERLSNQPEAVTREQLFEPAFQALGFTFKQGKEASSDTREPDYYLFAPGSDKLVGYCATYVWDRYLDGRDETRDAQTPDENPGAQVVSLLDHSDAPPWAIVTNGKTWRLYSARAHSRATNYYEIDLEEAIASPDPGIAFRYFWLLFRVQAFIRPADEGPSFLDRLVDESALYAKELEDRLKDRVFEEIFPRFAEGFIEYIRAQEGAAARLDQDRLDTVFQGTLTFLYRLLFLMYAESRDLLPVREERGYYQISLKRIAQQIEEAAGNIKDEASGRIQKVYTFRSTDLYDRLTALFAAVNEGAPAYNVPVYSGGLFSSEPADHDTSQEAASARFLVAHKIPDRFLAIGLDLLARDLDTKTQALVFIDYKSLGVRQLGSVYEGLLEFKLRVATESMVVVKGKKTDEIIPERDAGKARVKARLHKGEVYLENDRRERKATGSYYTPDYVVKYIVANTVGPVLEEKFAALRPKLREVELTDVCLET